MKHILTLVLLLTPLAALHAAAPPKPAKPNILFLVLDDLRPEENTNIASDPANKALVEKLSAQWLAGWKGAAAML